jgi:hypothetical protein
MNLGAKVLKHMEKFAGMLASSSLCSLQIGRFQPSWMIRTTRAGFQAYPAK